MLYCYFGHHKMASTFITTLVRHISKYVGLRSEVVNIPSKFNYNLGEHLLNNGTRFLCYVNAQCEYVNQITIPFKGFHVIRDPRDCIVSAYFSHRNSHSTRIWPELVEHRKNLIDLSTEEGLIAEISFSKELLTDSHKLAPFQCMKKWNYNQQNILELRYEDMINNETIFFYNVFEFLGLTSKNNLEHYKNIAKNVFRNKNNFIPSIREYTFVELLKLSSFSKLADGRLPGLQNDASHYRKGVSGDYINYFTPKVKAQFIKTFPGLLETLKYEVNDNW
jgi:hypothetical protein